MPRSSSHALARRALIEDIQADKRGWAQHGLAALAVSVLGLGVAGSVMLSSNATEQQPALTPVVAAPKSTATPAAKTPSAFDRDTISRGDGRPALSAAKVKSLAAQRAEALSKTEDKVRKAAQTKAMTAREKKLAEVAAATQKKAELIKSSRKAAAERAAKAKTVSPQAATEPAESTSTTVTATSSGKSSLPVTAGYTVAARFGAVGSWSRYHTGFDFAAPVGTPIHAATNGVVTNAGGGSASGWAGNYVAIKHADGTSTLYAHMSTVSVSVGQTVSGGQVIGAVGMTGRTFGPHVHFEVYPAGVTPGDVYRAVNPQPWLAALGLHP